MSAVQQLAGVEELARSEAQFKTTKYHPTFPERFDDRGHARCFCRAYMSWYNDEHHHTGLATLTPATVHHGRTEAVLETRQTTFDAAYAEHPERFIKVPPRTLRPPAEVWTNPPRTDDSASPTATEAGPTC